MRSHWPAVVFAAVPAVAHAQDASPAFALFQGLWFFGVMIVATIVLLALRIRDARSGLPEAERKARLQKRLPVAVGALVLACAPLFFR